MVAGERAGRDLVLGHALGPDLLGRLAERQRLGLGQEVGHQQVLVAAELVGRRAKPMKSAGISFVPWWISW